MGRAVQLPTPGADPSPALGLVVGVAAQWPRGYRRSSIWTTENALLLLRVSINKGPERSALEGPKLAGDPLEPPFTLPYFRWPPALTREEGERRVQVVGCEGDATAGSFASCMARR